MISSLGQPEFQNIGTLHKKQQKNMFTFEIRE